MNQWSGEVPDEQAGDWSFYSHRVLVAEMCTRRNRPRRKKSGERGEEEKERGRTFPTFSRHIPLWSQVPATYLPPPCVQPPGPPPPPPVPFPSVAFDLLLLCSPLEKKKCPSLACVALSFSLSASSLSFPFTGLVGRVDLAAAALPVPQSTGWEPTVKDLLFRGSQSQKKNRFTCSPQFLFLVDWNALHSGKKKQTNSSDFEGKSVGLTAERCRTCSATDWHCGQPIKQHTVGRNRKWILCPNWSHSFNRILCKCVCVCVGSRRFVSAACRGQWRARLTHFRSWHESVDIRYIPAVLLLHCRLLLDATMAVGDSGRPIWQLHRSSRVYRFGSTKYEHKIQFSMTLFNGRITDLFLWGISLKRGIRTHGISFTLRWNVVVKIRIELNFVDFEEMLGLV